MAIIKTRDVSQLWNSVGSIWGNLSENDKLLFEQIWTNYLQVFDQYYDWLDNLMNSVSTKTIPYFLSFSGEYFDLIFETTNEDRYGHLINTTKYSGDTFFSYEFDEDGSRIILDLENVQNVYYDESGNSLVYDSLSYDADYRISTDGRKLLLLNDPPLTADQNYSVIDRSYVYADTVKYLNPALFDCYGKQIGLSEKNFVKKHYKNYNTGYVSSGQELLERAQHFKYLIWALSYFKEEFPSMLNLEKGLSIARGIPFVYNSGIVNSVTNLGNAHKISLDDFDYYVPSGLTPSVSEGDAVDTFGLLVSGINLYDWTNDLNSAIMSGEGIPWQQYRSTLMLSIPSGCDDCLSYDYPFYSEYVNEILANGMNFEERLY